MHTAHARNRRSRRRPARTNASHAASVGEYAGRLTAQGCSLVSSAAKYDAIVASYPKMKRAMKRNKGL